MRRKERTQALLSPRPPCRPLCRPAGPADSAGGVREGLPVQLLQLPLPLHERAVPHRHPVGAGRGLAQPKDRGPVGWWRLPPLPGPRAVLSEPHTQLHPGDHPGSEPHPGSDLPQADGHGHEQRAGSNGEHDGPAGENHGGAAPLCPQSHFRSHRPPGRRRFPLPAGDPQPAPAGDHRGRGDMVSPCPGLAGFPLGKRPRPRASPELSPPGLPPRRSPSRSRKRKKTPRGSPCSLADRTCAPAEGDRTPFPCLQRLVPARPLPASGLHRHLGGLGGSPLLEPVSRELGDTISTTSSPSPAPTRAKIQPPASPPALPSPSLQPGPASLLPSPAPLPLSPLCQPPPLKPPGPPGSIPTKTASLPFWPPPLLSWRFQ